MVSPPVVLPLGVRIPRFVLVGQRGSDLGGRGSNPVHHFWAAETHLKIQPAHGGTKWSQRDPKKSIVEISGSDLTPKWLQKWSPEGPGRKSEN